MAGRRPIASSSCPSISVEPACEAWPTTSRHQWPVRITTPALSSASTSNCIVPHHDRQWAPIRRRRLVVIGIEPLWTQRIVDGVRATGKPCEGFAIEKNGDISTIAAASRKAKEYVQWASELTRVECPVKDLWVSVKCGESDTTSGLASNPTAAT